MNRKKNTFWGITLKPKIKISWKLVHLEASTNSHVHKTNSNFSDIYYFLNDEPELENWTEIWISSTSIGNRRPSSSYNLVRTSESSIASGSLADEEQLYPCFMQWIFYHFSQTFTKKEAKVLSSGRFWKFFSMWGVSALYLCNESFFRLCETTEDLDR